MPGPSAPLAQRSCLSPRNLSREPSGGPSSCDLIQKTAANANLSEASESGVEEEKTPLLSLSSAPSLDDFSRNECTLISSSSVCKSLVEEGEIQYS